MGPLKAKWDDLSLKVLGELELPPSRVLCWFDDKLDSEHLCCPSVPAVFLPLKGNKGNRERRPRDVKEHVCDEDGEMRDALVYLSGYACLPRDDVFFVMTFAHELQHFVQWGHSPESWKQCLHGFPGTGRWDVPTERDALIASRRITIKVIAPDAVAAYAQMKIDKGADTAYWSLFQSISPFEQYDWVGETERLTTQNRSQASR
ncbi:MAG TPA: hypothetical protein VGM18_20475 [Candidatus Sulfotelmatobacter sp.]|jgi:hypothetical protein